MAYVISCKLAKLPDVNLTNVALPKLSKTPVESSLLACFPRKTSSTKLMLELWISRGIGHTMSFSVLHTFLQTCLKQTRWNLIVGVRNQFFSAMKISFIPFFVFQTERSPVLISRDWQKLLRKTNRVPGALPLIPHWATALLRPGQKRRCTATRSHRYPPSGRSTHKKNSCKKNSTDFPRGIWRQEVNLRFLSDTIQAEVPFNHLPWQLFCNGGREAEVPPGQWFAHFTLKKLILLTKQFEVLSW